MPKLILLLFEIRFLLEEIATILQYKTNNRQTDITRKCVGRIYSAIIVL